MSRATRIIICISFIISAWAGPVHADMFMPRNTCYKPSKPYQFNNQWDLDRFKDDVETYRDCINNFIDDQNREAQTHLDAARKALDEWDNFVRWELN